MNDYVYNGKTRINIYHFLLLCFWQVDIQAIVLASVSIHVVRRFSKRVIYTTLFILFGNVFLAVWQTGCCILAFGENSCFEEFYVHKSRCFVVDYVYKCEFTDNYVTSFVPLGHMQRGVMTWLMFLTMCLWFFHNVMMVFQMIGVFYHVGGLWLDFGVSCL